MMKRLSVSLVALATFLGLSLVFAASTSAQTPVPSIPSSPPTETPVAALTILGQITNATPGGTLPVTTTVFLYGFDGQAIALRTSAVAGARGAVLFQNVANKPGRSFRLAATVGRTAYAGELQTPEPGAKELRLALKTYDTTADASQVVVAQMYVLGEYPSDRELRITNAYLLSSQGDRTVLDSEQAPDGRTGTLRFSLPREAANIQFGDRSADDFIRTDDGFLTTWGIPPGDNVSRVIVTYSLPYTGALHVELPVQYPVQGVTVLMVDQGVALASPQLQDHGPAQRQDGVPLRTYTGQAIAAGQSLAFDLTGTAILAPTSAENGPTEPNQNAATPRTPPDYRERIALAGIALGLILLAVCIGWWFLSGRKSKSDELDSLTPEQSALVQTLASLDEAHEAGRIGDAPYAGQRQALMAALMSALQQPSQVADTIPGC